MPKHEPESLQEAWEEWFASQPDIPPPFVDTLRKVFFVGAMAAHHLLVVKMRGDMEANDPDASMARIERFEAEIDEFVDQAIREKARHKAQRRAMTN